MNLPVPITYFRRPGAELFCARVPFGYWEQTAGGSRVVHELYAAIHREERAILTRRIEYPVKSRVTTDETIHKWDEVAVLGPEVQNGNDDFPVLDEAL